MTVAPLDPVALMRRIEQLFTPLAGEKGVRIALRIADQPPALIHADERLLERVFSNLVANALKFTPRDGCVTLGLVRADESQVEFSVADTGQGIPADQLEAVFEFPQKKVVPRKF